jgi:voltage-gated potassium channel
VGLRLSLARKTRFTPEFGRLLYKIVSAIILIATLVIVQGVGLWYFAGSDDSGIVTLFDGIYFAIISIFGETIGPSTLVSRIITLISLAEGLVLATYLIAVSAYFTIRGGRIMTRQHGDHFIICGWNFQAPRIIRELINARSTKHFDILVLPGDNIPEGLKEFGSNVFVITGSPADDKTLVAAEIESAKSVIVLSDPDLLADNADAWALMVTLAVETLNPSVYTCVQVMNSENAIHLYRANVDEIVPFDIIGANLSVASAINPGITKVVNELVHFDSGSEFYRVSAPLPAKLVGISFREAATWFRDRDMILIAVESTKLIDSYRTDMPGSRIAQPRGPAARGVNVNPKNHIILEDDALFVISDEKPDI